MQIPARFMVKVSKHCLEGKQYDFDTQKTLYSWRDSSLREWLNDAFFYTAFSENEQNAISLTPVDYSKSQGGKKNQYKVIWFFAHNS